MSVFSDDDSSPPRRGDNQKRCTSCSIPEREPIEGECKNKEFKRASEFRPKRPAFFALMESTNMARRFVLTIPQSFSKKYLPSEHENMIIRIPDRKEWPVNFHRKERSSSFTLGWEEFATENNLEVGDLCAFGLARDNTNTLMKCHIFKVSQDTE